MTPKCPNSGSIIYSRRNPLCGVCGKQLPPELLFTPEERAAVEGELSEMAQSEEGLPTSGDDKMVKNAIALFVLTLVFLGMGSMSIYTSLVALKNGTTIVFSGRHYHGVIHMSPWFPLLWGLVFLAVGIAGALKIFKSLFKD